MARLPDFPQAGGCVCGAVRYELTAPPLGAYRCHCKDCQRFSSGGYGLSMPVERANFRQTEGETVCYDKPADSGRTVRMHACPKCGTKLWNEPAYSATMLILKPGTLDDASWVRPTGNIWTASAVDWAIDPAELSFPQQPPSREPLFAAWAAQFEDA
jgi:hypothetical protein